MKVIVNVNLEIPAEEAKSYQDAVEIAENYELPKEYVEDSYEMVKVLDDNDEDVEELSNNKK